MRERLVDLLEKLDLTLALSREVLGEDQIESTASLAKTVRARLAYPDDLIIVALAGGTGSGKSSILNAISGEEMADVGGVRPTTSEPLAVAESSRIGSVAGYLDELGIEAVPAEGAPRWLALVDLPDTDSVEVEHRHLVETLLPSIDVVVWVADPEKYRDESLHSLIRRLTAHEGQMLFVLNQIDRLNEEARSQVVADFRVSLGEDGLADPTVIATAANPPSGPALGVDELVEALRGLAADPLVLQAKLLADIEGAASTLAGMADAAGTDFEAQVGDLVDEATRLIVNGETDPATARLTEFVETLDLHQLDAISAKIPAAVWAAYLKTGSPLVRRTRLWWTRSRRAASHPDQLTKVSESLTTELVDPMREVLRKRAQLAASVADLSLTVASLTTR